MSKGTEVATRGTARAPAHGNGAEEMAVLLHLAVEKGVNVELMERLVALKERTEDRNARAAFVEAMAAFKAECPALGKGSEVDYTTKAGVRVRYKFASLAEIARAVDPILAKHGLSYTWDSRIVDGRQMQVTCTLRHVYGHAESANFTCTIDDAGSPTMNGPQKAGSAITYGERYSFIQVLGLTTADPDDDAVGHHHAAGGTETITEQQAADLEVLIEEVKADKPKFLRFLQVASLADLRVADLQAATAALEQKRRRP